MGKSRNCLLIVAASMVLAAAHPAVALDAVSIQLK
jgi:hypothetical protein